jgi:pimeloyl-ACP methyl ester carboxylesterase
MGASAEGVYRGGSGEPLVLIHGFSGTWMLWAPVPAALESLLRADGSHHRAELRLVIDIPELCAQRVA